MNEDEKTVKHMEFVQAVIARMAGNSFFLKGWTITLVAALFALAGASAKPIFIFIALLPALSFWGLDAYYLQEERLFRELYYDLQRSFIDKDQVRVEPFSFSTRDYQRKVSSWFRLLWSPSIFAFHGVIIGAILVFLLVI